MSPRTALALSEAEARASAIAKLDARVQLTPPGIGTAVFVARARGHEFINVHRHPIDTVGHQLQRAAAENA